MTTMKPPRQIRSPMTKAPPAAAQPLLEWDQLRQSLMRQSQMRQSQMRQLGMTTRKVSVLQVPPLLGTALVAPPAPVERPASVAGRRRCCSEWPCATADELLAEFNVAQLP